MAPKTPDGSAPKPAHVSSKEIVQEQLKHLQISPQTQQQDEILSSPLLTVPLVERRLYHNVACPSSVFICGSQGSGKSNTLACLLENCLLENCLIPSKLGQLPNPLTGIVFHYDSFVSDSGGLPCEAAFLASSEKVSVRVLCAPTNIRTIQACKLKVLRGIDDLEPVLTTQQRMYSGIPGVRIEPLRLTDKDLNTRRMNDLMAIAEGGSMPLYLHVVNRILRDMRIEQQRTGSGFSYQTFKRHLDKADLTPMQRGPLGQRLDTLESFMAEGKGENEGKGKGKGGKAGSTVGWEPKAGQLTVVDLSCPCVTAELACSLFNICLSLFLEQKSSVGRVVAMDEAHKYMRDSAESQALTNSLLETIRLQRHLGVRVLISTQEPTVSTKLLDLCSVTVVHRFTSPDWLRTLRGHLTGISSMSVTAAADGDKQSTAVKPIAIGGKGEDAVLELFAIIVSLHTGQALVFAPSAVLELGAKVKDREAPILRLAHRALKVKVRSRLTKDGGKTVMA
ncbi:hypothetical protein CPLU01_06044 [Colletotrichum plurivorum]|uniref:P-loop containing nucleoside triphosphate hydrolase n=1 Tax=Colletotrichum plurivorum TaxID=2175906 RepID=A0A8H6KJZ0_9PEZI|nr:hypothetical protein CPLU01_06044 [Colletotrichum plurivorum]